MSSGRLRTLIVFDPTIDVERVHAALPAGAATQTIAFASGVDHALTTLDEMVPELLIVGCAGSTEAGLTVIETARRRHADCVIIALHGDNPNGFMRRAFQAGADDLVTVSQSREALAFAFEKAIARRRGSSPSSSLAPLICIVGPKGGTGKTLTACNLAVALGRAGRRPALVDLDLQFGDVGLALGLEPERTIYDLAVAGGSLDAEKVRRYLAHHQSGVNVLLAPVRPDQAAAIEIGFLRELYGTLRAEHDFVIVDTPPAFTPEVIATIDESTHLCVVGMLDALSLKDTKIGLETLDLMGLDRGGIRLVLNRADSSVGIGRGDVDRILGRRPDVLVPSDRAIPRSITDAVPIVLADGRSGAAHAFTSLAAFYLGQVEPANGNGNGNGSGRRTLLRKGK